VGTKQVIVMKKFPKARNMRTGKYIAQGSHASLGAFLALGNTISADGKSITVDLTNPFARDWIVGRFTKVTCQVETDEELVALHKAAQEANIATALITDAGLTEFDGVPTLTAVGIGPDNEELINKITGHLPLF
jgi:peptidyl-tRNA hydrolase, PTH2 family